MADKMGEPSRGKHSNTCIAVPRFDCFSQCLAESNRAPNRRLRRAVKRIHENRHTGWRIITHDLMDDEAISVWHDRLVLEPGVRHPLEEIHQVEVIFL